jgi:hypothetical protein
VCVCVCVCEREGGEGGGINKKWLHSLLRPLHLLLSRYALKTFSQTNENKSDLTHSFSFSLSIYLSLPLFLSISLCVPLSFCLPIFLSLSLFLVSLFPNFSPFPYPFISLTFFSTYTVSFTDLDLR